MHFQTYTKVQQVLQTIADRCESSEDAPGAHLFEHGRLQLVLAALLLLPLGGSLQQEGGAEVGGHDDDGVLEAHHPPVGVRQPPVVQHLVTAMRCL
jgi:hypothetical protein